MKPLDSTQFKILIVDDNPKNIQVVGNLLRQEKYPTAFALNGAQALEMVHTDHFDLILLDVMMPDMDGYDVCRQLKAQTSTQDIPVIFLTAKTDVDSIVQGFEIGAYDYVTKPFISQELLVRVKSQLYIKSLHDELKSRYAQIKELEQMKDALTHMIIHDLKSPLNIISGYADLLLMNDDIGKDSQAFEYIHSIKGGSRTMMDMIADILDVTRLEKGEMELNLEAMDLSKLIENVTQTIQPVVDQVNIKIKPDLPDQLPRLWADRELVRRIVSNIVNNAIRFSPSGSTITLNAAIQNEQARITISDQGRGIPKAYHESIFSKYKQVHNQKSKAKYSTGLGLAFCKMAVEAMKGQIGVISEPEQGCTFWFTLPTA